MDIFTLFVPMDTIKFNTAFIWGQSGPESGLDMTGTQF